MSSDTQDTGQGNNSSWGWWESVANTVVEIQLVDSGDNSYYNHGIVSNEHIRTHYRTDKLQRYAKADE